MMKAHVLPRVLCPYCGTELRVSERPYGGRLGAYCINSDCTNPYREKGCVGRFEIMSQTVDVEPYDVVNSFDSARYNNKEEKHENTTSPVLSCTDHP